MDNTKSTTSGQNTHYHMEGLKKYGHRHTELAISTNSATLNTEDKQEVLSISAMFLKVNKKV